jgi:hypothetical protein
MSLTKAELELRVFDLFAKTTGLLPGGKSESREPPEPDILYVPDHGPALAFELVRIIDEDYAESVGRMSRTTDACISYIDSLPYSKAAEFRNRFSNADIWIDFLNKLTLPQRKRSLKKVFEALLTLPHDYDGEAFANGNQLRGIVNRIVVSRGNFVGPVFNPMSMSSVSDPTVDALSSKMTKSYEPRGKLNLLAYIDTNPMYPDRVWLPNLARYLDSLDKTCQFESIYVFECESNRIRRAWHKDS